VKSVDLQNGLRLTTSNGGIEEIIALREDVLRVRVAKGPALPEDVSWAVLPQTRQQSVMVEQQSDATTVGFNTQKLQVAVSRSDLRLTVRDAQGHIVQQDAAPLHFDGSSFQLAKVMPADEHYFGLGDKTEGLDRRGHAFSLWNTDAYRFQESTDPIYKAIPFFMAYRAGVATGVLLDNTWRTNFDFGKRSPVRYSFGSVDGPLDYYIFLGPSPREVVETYAWLTGKPPMPPMWMLGFQQSRYSYETEARVMEIANRLRGDRIPADALYLDIDFQDRNRPFSVNTKAFPDLAGMLLKLRTMDFHVVAITDLHIAKAPGQNYLPYDSGLAGDHFVHRPDGSVYDGVAWPGFSVFPDFTRKQTRAWWGSLYQPFVQAGFAGFWNDMSEPSVFNSSTGTMPEDSVHRIDEPGFTTRSATHGEIHNVLGLENSRATYEGLRKLQPNVRPFVLTRATYAGGQRYAATWTGDNSSTWNHLRMTGPMLKNLGLSGFSFSGADVGGFAGTATSELLTKWIEVGAFQPIDRDHTEKGTGDQEPWVGGPEPENVRRRYIEERYRLMPYLYTLAEETARTGLPMMRPLFLDYPNAVADGHPIDVDAGIEGEFLLGHDLLIAPSPYPEAPDTYVVEFPSAVWYDYWTGSRVVSPARAAPTGQGLPISATDMVPLNVKVTPDLATLPVYVRGGAILPVAPLVQSTDETPKGAITLRIYVGEDCKGSLYLDDGKSFDYQQGKYLREQFTCRTDANRLEIHVGKREGSFAPWWTEVRLEIYGWNSKVNEVRRDGGAARIEVEQSQASISLTVPDNGDGTLLVLQ
jgi:alpha-glucosidase